MLLSAFVLLLEFLVLTLGKDLGFQEQPDSIILICIFLYSAALLAEVSFVSPYKKYGVIIAVGLLVRLAFLVWSKFGVISFATSGDGGAFMNAAIDISRGVRRIYGGLYTKTLGFIFSCIGTSSMVARFYSVVTSMITILVVVHILEYLDIKQTGKNIALWVVCLLPNYAMLSASIYRETTITMFLTFSLYCFIKWFFEGKKVLFFFSIGLSLMASVYHSGSVCYTVAYVLVFILYDTKARKYVLRRDTLLVSCVFLLLFIFLFNNFKSVFFSKMDSVEDISDIAFHYGGGSSYLRYVGDSNTIPRFILFTPLRMVYYLFSPFVWQWRGLKDVVAFFLDALVYLGTIIITLRNTKKNNQKQLIIALLICALLNAFVFGWGSSNTAQAMRHRSKSITYYGLMIAVSLDNLLVKGK